MGCAATTRLTDVTFDANRESVIIRRAGLISLSDITPEVYHITHLYRNLISQVNPDKPCLSYLPPNSEQYVSITYKKVNEMAEGLAKGLLELNLLRTTKDDLGKDIKIIGVMAITRYEWFILVIASWLLNATLVPLYSTLGKEALLHILKSTEMSIAFVGSALMSQLALTANEISSNLHTMVSFEDSHPEIPKMRILTLKEIIEAGLKSNKELPEPCKDCISQIIYTSGTTGIPKGVVTTHKMCLSFILGIYRNPYYIEQYTNCRYFSCLPMAHAYESIAQIFIFLLKGHIGFSTGNIKRIIDDMRAFSPHITTLVPKIISRMISLIDLAFKDLTGFKKKLVEKAIKSKLQNIAETNKITHTLYDAIVFKKIRTMVGGNLRRVHSGSAPMTLDVFQKFQIYTSARIVQGYGLTESLAGSSIQEKDNHDLCVGIPFPCIEFKIANVPDLNYYVTDYNAEKIPEPRGMVCLRGNSVFTRYYKNPEMTNEAFKDGWYLTGDVASMLPNGSIKIIDRVKSLIKLAQGEYISPERLEGIYGKSLLIAQIFIHGESTKSDVVAIIIPEREAVKKWALKQGMEYKDFEVTIGDEKLKMAIAEEMKKLAKDQNLNRWEFPRNIWLSSTEMTADNGLATPTMKLKRRELAAYYKVEIEKCYNMNYLFQREE